MSDIAPDASAPDTTSSALRDALVPALRDTGKRVAGHVSAVLAALSAPRAVRGVLVYHRIVDPVPGLPEPTWNVPPGRFEAQIQGLLDAGVRFAPLDAVLAGEAAVAVTFDDVFGSVVTEALPVLRRLGVPSTLFVATAHVGAERMPFDDWEARDRAPVETTRAATLAELEALSGDPLVTIGAHTHTHGDFRGRPDAFEADLRTNLRWLADRLAVQNPALAFPYGRTAYGYAGGELSRRAAAAGVAGALTTDAEAADGADPFAWPRSNVYAWDTARTIAAKLTGHYAWAPRLMERAE